MSSVRCFGFEVKKWAQDYIRVWFAGSDEKVNGVRKIPVCDEDEKINSKYIPDVYAAKEHSHEEYTAKNHTHSSSDITDLSDRLSSIESRLTTLENKLDAMSTNITRKIALFYNEGDANQHRKAINKAFKDNVTTTAREIWLAEERMYIV